MVYLTNVSFNQCKFSDLLKINKIIPGMRKGDAMNLENYHLIALISIFSKILEYCFLDRQEIFIKVNKIVITCQFGFIVYYVCSEVLE